MTKLEMNKTKKDKNSNEKDLERKRQPCEIFSRVVGYIRPVHQWNPGKQSEFKDRKMIDIEEKNKKIKR